MAEAMRPTIRRALLLFALAMLMVSAFGCGGPEAGDEPTTKPDAPTASSIPTTVQTLVVDGDTSEEYEAALPSLEAAVAADENDLAALQDLAVAQFQTGRYEEAAATYERMLAIQENAFVRNNYANVLRDWGKTDEAEKQYRKAIDLDPTLTFPYVNLASVLSKQDDIAGAIAVLESGIKKVSDEDKESFESLIERLKKATTTT